MIGTRNLDIAKLGLAAAVIAFAACMCALLFVQPAHAEENVYDTAKYKSATHHVALDPCNEDRNTITIENPMLVFGKVKSSNKKVAKTEIHDAGIILTITFKKAGKSVVTYKVKGKSYKHTYIVHKYTNPLKSFKTGSVQHAKKFKRSSSYTVSGTVSGKLQLKPAKGWKVSKIRVVMAKRDGNYLYRTVKNGTRLKDTTSSIVVRAKHAKTKRVEYVELMVAPRAQ